MKIIAYFLAIILVLGITANLNYTNAVITPQQNAEPIQITKSKPGITQSNTITPIIDLNNQEQKTLEDLLEDCPAGLFVYKLNGEVVIACIVDSIYGQLFGAHGQIIDVNIDVENNNNNKNNNNGNNDDDDDNDNNNDNDDRNDDDNDRDCGDRGNFTMSSWKKWCNDLDDNDSNMTMIGNSNNDNNGSNPGKNNDADVELIDPRNADKYDSIDWQSDDGKSDLSIEQMDEILEQQQQETEQQAGDEEQQEQDTNNNGSDDDEEDTDETIVSEEEAAAGEQEESNSNN